MRKTVLGVAAWVLVSVPQVAAAEDLTVADLEWPATTRSAVAGSSTEVYEEARAKKRIGKLARHTRVGWRKIVATGDRCKAWLEIEPRGWVCAKDLEPSDETPAAEKQPTLGEDGVPGKFADIRGLEVDSYDSVGDIRAGTPAHTVSGQTFVRVIPDKTAKVDGVRYQKTDQGWIEAKKLRHLYASDFAGLDLTTAASPQWPFAWATPRKKGAEIWVRATPKKRGDKVRELERRELVSVLEEKKGWVRIGEDEWVDAKELRIARQAARPEGVGAGEQWLDVDLDQQVLIAYRGDAPVYATMISSGRIKFKTPTGIYRIARKYGKTRMVNPRPAEVTGESWDVADVPWAMKFRKNFALHGAYWHDGFGKPRSHGCVNLSPADARWVYDWTAPVVPDGWTMLEVEEALGTPVRIRTRRDPDPPWKDFQGRKLDDSELAGAGDVDRDRSDRGGEVQARVDPVDAGSTR